MAGMGGPKKLQVPTKAGMKQQSVTTEEVVVTLDTTESVSIIADAPVKVGMQNTETMPEDYILLLANERLSLDIACTKIVLQAVSAAANVKITYTQL